MRPDVLRVVPDSIIGKSAISLGLVAATPLIAWGTRQVFDRATEAITKPKSEVQANEDLENVNFDNGGIIPEHDGLEMVLVSNSDIQPKIVFDLDALRSKGLI